MRRAFGVLLAALTVTAPAVAGTRGTGLRGTVTRSPIAPVCQVGVSCSAPARHVKITFARKGVTTSVVTGEDGRYRVVLSAGTYAVRIPSARLGFEPRTVVVSAGRVSTRNFSIDTGIR